MELRWTLCPNLTNTRLLSSGIIWFWSRANIPWLDFVIDSARAVKVSQSPGTQRRAHAYVHTLTFSKNLAHKAVSFHRRNQEDSFQGLMPGIYFFVGIVRNDGVRLSHFLYFTCRNCCFFWELFFSKLSSTKLTHHDGLVTDVPGDSSAKNDGYF